MPPTENLGFVHIFVPADPPDSHAVTLLLHFRQSKHPLLPLSGTVKTSQFCATDGASLFTGGHPAAEVGESGD
jgi:hypothetical protein